MKAAEVQLASATWRSDGALVASLEATGEGLVCVDTDRAWSVQEDVDRRSRT